MKNSFPILLGTFCLFGFQLFGQTCSISASQTNLCSGQSSLLSITHDLPLSSTISWTPTTQTSNTITVTPTSTTNYSCTVTDGSNSCVATITITVNSIPSITSTTPESRCDAGTVNLNAVASAGVVNWYAAPIGGTSLSTGNTYIPNISTTTIFYTDATNNGCTSPRTAVTATINPTPSITSQSQTICSTGSFNIYPTNGAGNIVPNGTTYSWSAPSVTGISGAVVGNSASNISGTLTNGTNAAIQVAYTVTPASGNCIGSSFTTTITVNPKPSVIAQTTTICSAGSFNISPTNGTGSIVPTGTTYSWSAPSVTGISGTFAGNSASNISGTLTNGTNAAISVDYTVIPTSGSCAGLSFMTTITVNPKPSVLAQTTTICSSGSFNISPTNGAGNIVPTGTTYSWSAPSVTGISGTVAGNSASNISGTLTNGTNAAIQVAYTVTPTSGNCIGSSFTTTITVNPKPSVLAQTANICSAGTFNISPTNGAGNIVPTGTTYSWSAPSVSGISGTDAGNSASNISGTLTNGTNAAIQVSYIVTPTSGNCIGSSFMTTITVNPKSSVLAQTTIICSAGSFNISPTNGAGNIVPTGTTYSWSAPSVTGISGTVAGNSASNISGTLTNGTNAAIQVAYTVTPTSGNCIGSSFTTTITVNPKPSVIAQTATICSAGSFNISPNNGIGNIVPTGTIYSWSAPSVTGISGTVAGNSVSNISGTLTNGTNAAIQVVYAITPTSGSCIGNSFNATITIKPIPVIITNNQEVCSNTTFQGNWVTPNTVPLNTYYTWTVTNNTQVIGETNNNVSSAFSQTLSNLTLQNQNVVYVITPIADACVGSPFTLNLEVKPSPPANAGQDFVKTCIDNINGSSIGGASTPGFIYSWLPSAGLNLSNISNPNANPNITTLFTLTVTDLLSNCSAKDSVLVTVNNTPPSANAGTDGNITCVTNPNGITIGSSPTNGNSYAWSPITGLASSNSSSTVANPNTSQTYTITVTNNINGCTSTDQVNVTVNKVNPSANAGVDFIKTCTANNNGSQIGTAAISGNNYSWTPALGLSNSTIANPTANPSVTTTYTLVVTNSANGCSSSDQVTVDVNQQQPFVSAGSDFTKTCIANTFGANIGMSPQPNTSYSWSPSTTLTSGILSNPIANPSSTTTYTLTATSLENGCTANDQVIVSVNQNYPAVNAGIDFTKTCVSNTNGNTIGMSAVTGMTYSWFPSTGLSSIGASNPIANPSQTTLFTLTSTDVVNGCTSTDQVLITVNNELPTAYAGLDALITCNQNVNGAVIGMQPENGINYTWFPSTGLSSSNQSQVLAHPNQNSNYTLTATNPINGCVHTDVVNVIVDTVAPTVNAGADVVICEGQMVQLSGASNSSNVSWSPSFMVQNVNELTTTATINGSTTFTLTSVGSNGCVATDALTAQIAESTPSGLLSNYIVCENETINLTVSPQLTCNWSGLYTGTQNDIDFIGSSSGNLNIETTNNNGCTSSETIAITVNPIPYPIISGAQAICQNSYWEKYSIPSSPNQINWTATNGDIMSSANANDVVIHWGTGATGTVNVTETISETGCSNDYSYTVLLGENVALDTAEVLQLSSSVLYTPNVYSFMNWGYESIITQIPVSVGVYSQYCEFPNFNPSLNYYWVEIGDGNGCITKSYFNNPNFIANIQNVEQNNVEIFPNPTEGVINIKTDLDSFNFEIINPDGQKVMSGSGDYSLTLPLIEIPSGIYFMNIKSKGYQYNQKIIKL